LVVLAQCAAFGQAYSTERLFNDNDSPTAICSVIYIITWKDHPENGMSIRSWKQAAVTCIKMLFKRHQEKERPNLTGQPRVRKYFIHLLKHQEDI
jgi:hypothetical protein